MKIKINSAGIIIIGNEILSGRTLDTNSNFICNSCTKLGIPVNEVIVISDTKKLIIKTVKNFSKRYRHVFVTGGIGPTHDDITAESLAEAFNRKLILNKKAKKVLNEYYEKSNIKLNESRLKMAYIPERATLIDNSVSAAPGFKLKNVWVMAGVPKIMQAMFTEYIEPRIKRGKKIYTKDININRAEGEIAELLSSLQKKFPSVELGSYPFIKGIHLGTNVVIRSTIKKQLLVVYKKLKSLEN